MQEGSEEEEETETQNDDKLITENIDALLDFCERNAVDTDVTAVDTAAAAPAVVEMSGFVTGFDQELKMAWRKSLAEVSRKKSH